MDWTMSWWVLMTPEQLGPRIRHPRFFTITLMPAWAFLPSSPISAKPAVSTTWYLTPLAQHSSMAMGTVSAGTMMMAASTGPSTSRTDL